MRCCCSIARRRAVHDVQRVVGWKAEVVAALMRRAMHFVTKTCTLDNDHIFRKAYGLLQEGYGVYSTEAPRVSLEQKMPRRWARLYAEKAHKLLRGG